MSQKASFLKSNWKKYLFELLVIIAGITISFGLQNWNEQRNHRQHEIQILERMLQDLAVDTTSIQEEINSLTVAVEGGQRLIDLEKLGGIDDSIGYYISSQLRYSIFTKSDIAYQGFRQTGRSDLVSDQKLLDKIVRLYAINYEEIEEYGEIDKNFILNQFIPYIYQTFPNLQFSDLEETEKALLPILEEDSYQNFVLFNLSFKSQMIEKYKENLGYITSLMNDIEKELEQLR